MISEEIEVVFSKEDVQQFVQILGDPNPIYQSIEGAKSSGLPTIPLPPAMPAITYKWITAPWELKPPVIHRKQECRIEQPMFIDQKYKAVVTLDRNDVRGENTFVQQSLKIFDLEGKLYFQGISHLIAGGVK
ncbi:MaoC family dehydratase [Bacillus sp. S/N-304-OC-R1]|uniref:MaoC family dehydratase n=1 Tax=Bacillus sp. S/N-304-OC-R1 TaxID=2758034 RepID=UPI001C8E6D1D|nr:MaoC family dehydratase [Bacillus sp. S/N-304-OC-R1]MBY0121434.1 MaoC family dehydratase [Bacillus sp. S/N-304-OC-R1]